MKIPFVLIGDHPDQPTGLARILGDLSRHLHRDYPQLDVRTIGYVDWAGIGPRGVAQDPTDRVPWPHWVFSQVQKNWGADAVIEAYRRWFGARDGFLFSIWDPGRCLPLAAVPLPVVRWGYFAVDAENVNGGLSGPAAEAVRGYDRVLAYTAFGARVLQSVYADSRALGGAVPDLPHGIYANVFTPFTSPEDVRRAQTILRVPDGRAVIGCVATNHNRKDWGLVAQTLRLLLERGHDLHLWAHTDRPVSEAWSLPQLFADCGLEDRVTLTPTLGDLDLAKCYAACVATIAPGRGEGFGYPIVESNSCGAPCFHVDYAGGAAQTTAACRVEPFCYHLVGPYALKRPILDSLRLALTLDAFLRDGKGPDQRVRARTHALAYDWSTLWPTWRAWIDRGLGLTTGERD